MAVDRRHLLGRIEEIAFEEQRSIRAAVDAAFFTPGWRIGPSLTSGSARAIAAGVRRATARIADEIWAIAEIGAPGFAADARRVAKHLRIRMVGYYRQRLMSDEGPWKPEEIIAACRELSGTLHDICNEMVDDVMYRSTPLPSAPLPEAPELVAFGPAAAPRSIPGQAPGRQAQGIDLDALPTVLSEIRKSIAAAPIDAARRRALVRQIAAIEAFMERPNPHRGMLLSMVRRLPPALKLARLDMAGSFVESFIEQEAMPPSKAS
jgi:hypothetical protein